MKNFLTFFKQRTRITLPLLAGVILAASLLGNGQTSVTSTQSSQPKPRQQTSLVTTVQSSPSSSSPATTTASAIGNDQNANVQPDKTLVTVSSASTAAASSAGSSSASANTEPSSTSSNDPANPNFCRVCPENSTGPAVACSGASCGPTTPPTACGCGANRYKSPQLMCPMLACTN